MKVGDYVRTNLNEEHIIARIVNIAKSIDGSNWLDLDRYTKYNYYDDQPEYFKSSPNIIDLIEVGDYVNGSKVQEIGEDYVEIEEYSGLNNDMPCVVKEEDIKSIVTKEQFESMEYKI